MTRAVAYTRVSSNEQLSGFGLDLQEEACTRYAKQNSLSVIKIFKEKGVSAKTVTGRPKLLELIKFCQNSKNNVGKVLVYKYDRWSRNTEEGLGVISLLAKQGVELVSVTEPAQNNAFGKAIRGMMLVFAELDNNIKSERTTDGMKAAFNAGRWPWKAKIGYKHTLVSEKKKLILLKPFLPILTNLFNEAASGYYSKKQLASKLNKAGFSKLWGSPATEKTVDTIIKSRFYYGVMVSKKWGLEAKGNHAVVTDEQTWIRVNESLYGKSAATSSIWIGCAYFSFRPPPPGRPAPTAV